MTSPTSSPESTPAAISGDRKGQRIRNTALAIFDLIRGPWLPLVIFLLSYTITTALGGLYFLTPSGQHDLYFLVGKPFLSVQPIIGSPVYLAVLLLPFVIVPVFAFLGIASLRRFMGSERLAELTVSPWALFAIATASITFCLYRLQTEGALLPDLDVDYRANILERVRLFETLGSAFYIVLYGVLPMTSVMFLARFLRSRSLFDAIGFLITFGVVYFLIFDTLAKSHLLVFSLMLISVVLLSRANLWLIPVLAVVSFTAFTLTDYALTGRAAAQLKSAAPSTVTPRAPTTPADLEHHEKLKKLEPPKPETPLASQGAQSAEPPVTPKVNPIKNIIFRMSTPLPFYIALFGNAAERCGIEAHSVRRLLGLGPSHCVLPIKVFAAMWPETNWVTGYAPAAAHISAYGEAGLIWSIIVMAISGLCLGLLGALASLGTGPLFVALGVAGCTFGYYLSQLPLVATFTYGHGLVFLTLPIVVVGLPAFLSRRNQHAR